MPQKTARSLIVIATIAAFLFFNVSYALEIPGTISFSGKISSVTPCGNGLLLGIDGNDGGGKYLFQDGFSILYPEFKLSNISYVQGSAIYGGVCPLGPKKGNINADGIIVIVRTGQASEVVPPQYQTSSSQSLYQNITSPPFDSGSTPPPATTNTSSLYSPLTSSSPTSISDLPPYLQFQNTSTSATSPLNLPFGYPYTCEKGIDGGEE